MVKMELKHNRPSGHARSDPILSQTCPSDHVHSFYGPMEFHPNTTYEDLVRADKGLSSSNVEENQSLYWHPTVYQVSGTSVDPVYNRVPTSLTTYYRWDNTVLPRTEEFPPGFRIIASSADRGAPIFNMFSECCNYPGGVQDCQTETGLKFPNRNCHHLDIALAAPTCWDGVELGDTNDHRNHMAYTVDGSVTGPCPNGFNHRFPQVQLFLAIRKYKGATVQYQLSHSSSEYHIDFFNGWKEGKLQEIIDKCEPDPNQQIGEVNPGVRCSPNVGDNRFLTESFWKGSMCDKDVRTLIIDEQTDGVTGLLPRGSCTGYLIPKSWDRLNPNVLPSSLCSNGLLEDEIFESDDNKEEDDLFEDEKSTVTPTARPTARPTNEEEDDKRRKRKRRRRGRSRRRKRIPR
jgi:hypothetical protein